VLSPRQGRLPSSHHVSAAGGGGKMVERTVNLGHTFGSMKALNFTTPDIIASSDLPAFAFWEDEAFHHGGPAADLHHCQDYRGHLSNGYTGWVFWQTLDCLAWFKNMAAWFGAGDKRLANLRFFDLPLFASWRVVQGIKLTYLASCIHGLFIT
jgi:hypothetical protein